MVCKYDIFSIGFSITGGRIINYREEANSMGHKNDVTYFNSCVMLALPNMPTFTK
ncbi:MAG: hypothetical protein ACKVQB_13180 [Bacteroidia bacterium]